MVRRSGQFMRTTCSGLPLVVLLVAGSVGGCRDSRPLAPQNAGGEVLRMTIEISDQQEAVRTGSPFPHLVFANSLSWPLGDAWVCDYSVDTRDGRPWYTDACYDRTDRLTKGPSGELLAQVEYGWVNDDRTEFVIQVSTVRIGTRLDASEFEGVLREEGSQFPVLAGGQLVELDPGRYSIRGIIGDRNGEAASRPSKGNP